MGVLSQRSYFGEAPGRLQAALDLDGIIPLQLEDTIRPVVIIADGLAPGMSRRRNRRWGYTPGAGVATGTNVTLQAQGDGLIIDQLIVAASVGSGTSVLGCYYYPAGTAPPVPATTPAGVLLDWGLGDRPPLLVATGAGVPAQGQFVSINLGNTIAIVAVAEPFFLAPGASFVVRPVLGSGNCTVTVRGRIF